MKLRSVIPIMFVICSLFSSSANAADDTAALLREAMAKYRSQQYDQTVALASQAIGRDSERFPCSHYMGDVARVHRKLRKEAGD